MHATGKMLVEHVRRLPCCLLRYCIAVTGFEDVVLTVLGQEDWHSCPIWQHFEDQPGKSKADHMHALPTSCQTAVEASSRMSWTR